VIEARSLTKVYGGKAAVDGIDFQVKPGVVTGFLGPNGAGKSTTMRMILGLDPEGIRDAVCYMTAAGLIGLFTGVLVRSAAAAITSVFARPRRLTRRAS
jgi:ABC-type glutathione transport system ATPase component